LGAFLSASVSFFFFAVRWLFSLLKMPGGRFRRESFILDALGDDAEEPQVLGGLPNELTSGLGGLTIVSLVKGDTSWLNVGGMPA
jgi:hypothetical protein